MKLHLLSEKRVRNSRSPFFALLGATCLALSVAPAEAATRTWDGGFPSNDDFTAGQNWVGDVAPAPGDNLVFDGSVRLFPFSNFGGFTNFNDITFNPTASSFTIVGNPIGITGAVTNNSSVLQTIGNGNDVAFRTGTNTVNAVNGNLRFNNGNVYLDINNLSINTGSGRTVTFDANLRNGGGQGTSTVTYNGSGTVVLNQYSQYGSNSGGGGSIINGGTVRFVNSKSGSSSNSGVGSNNYSVASGATLEFNITGSNFLNFDGYNGGAITGTGTFIKSGSGTLAFGGSAGGNTQMSMGGTGLIDVQGGILRNDYGRQDWDNNNASMNVASGATVDTWDGINGIRVNALTGSGTVTHTNYNTNGSQVTNTLTVGVANGSGTFAGRLTDADGGGGGGQHFLGLTKNGTGTQTLTGSNNYRGATAVNAGTLLVNGNQAAASGAVTVATTGTIGGSGTLGGNTTMNGTLSAGPASNSTAVLSFNNGLALGGASNSLFEINGLTRGTTYDGVNVLGSLAYNGTLTIDFGFNAAPLTTFDLFNFVGVATGNYTSVVFLDAGYAGTFNPLTGDLTLTAVPEPGTVTLIGLGLGLVLWRKRSRLA